VSFGPPFEFDPAKNEANRIKHGIGLDAFRGFDCEPTIVLDARRDYGEDRYRAFGNIDETPYMVAFAFRNGRTRLISFRRVHRKDMIADE
jgi:uncharacterized DUF497 family protein